MPKIRVLLVDDEVEFTANMKRVLTRRGFDVKDDDVKMAGMDGTQVLKEIKRVAPDINVIILTGHYSSS